MPTDWVLQDRLPAETKFSTVRKGTHGWSNAGENITEDIHCSIWPVNENPNTSPQPSRRRAVSGSRLGTSQRSAPPTRVLRMLPRRLVRAIVFVFRGSLGLHRHDEGLALRQVGPALGHVRLCPIQHHSYGMIGRHTHTAKAKSSPAVMALQS